MASPHRNMWIKIKTLKNRERWNVNPTGRINVIIYSQAEHRE
jgi:hypothetical protein